MKFWLTWTYTLRFIGVVGFIVGVTGLQWPPHTLGSVVIASLGALFGPDAVRAREGKA
jgi:hypothetical protein